MIDDTSLKGVKETSQLEYNSSLEKCTLNYRSVYSQDKNAGTSNSSMLFNFYMSNLLLQNNREKLLELRQLNVDAKVRKVIFFS